MTNPSLVHGEKKWIWAHLTNGHYANTIPPSPSDVLKYLLRLRKLIPEMTLCLAWVLSQNGDRSVFTSHPSGAVTISSLAQPPINHLNKQTNKQLWMVLRGELLISRLRFQDRLKQTSILDSLYWTLLNKALIRVCVKKCLAKCLPKTFSACFSFSSQLPRNLKESFLEALLCDLHAWLFRCERNLQTLNISRHSLLKSVMSHLRPYNCFSVDCPLDLFQWEGPVSVWLLLQHLFFFLNCIVCHFWWTLDSFRCS